MLVFSGKNTYEEFIREIGNGMTSDTFESDYGFPHINGFDYLASIKDEILQKKVMEALKFVDRELDFSKKNNEMYKKLSYFLKVGILFGEYGEYISLLSPFSISTLVTESFISFSDEEAKKHIPVCANEELLTYVRKKCEYREITDILFAVCQHYDQRPFDVRDSSLLEKFQQNELDRLKENKEDFFSGVKSVQDIAQELSTKFR